MPPMTPEQKSALLARLKAGREHHKALRAKDPNHKPRKPRKKKGGEVIDPKEAIPDPLAVDAKRENKVNPINGAKPDAKNVVANAPVEPEKNESSMIDVPNLPNEKNRKEIIENPEVIPKRKPVKGIASTGVPKKYESNKEVLYEQSGMQSIESMLPGQKESIIKNLRKNKQQNKPIAQSVDSNPSDSTVKNVSKHVADIKSVEGRAPFSMSAVRKLLYQ